MIFCADPKTQYLLHKEEIDAAISRVINGGQYILGPEVEAFEKEFADFVGVRHCVGVGNGTEALHMALTVLGIGHGDEVITVSNTAVATVAAIEMTGAIPLLVDIDPRTYVMDPRSAEQAITSRTRAIVPVHLYGYPANMIEITHIARTYNLYVIEDCAQAHGTKIDSRSVGTFGEMASFSFYPTKNLGAIGDGGAVVTNNSEAFEKLRRLRQYGWEERFISNSSGWNSRLDEIQASVLRVKLNYLDKENEVRIRNAEYYRKNLKNTFLTLPETERAVTHVYHQYVVRTPGRNDFLDFLRTRKIAAAIHYPVPIHKQPAYRHLITNLPETEYAAEHILSLPIHPGLTDDDMAHVVNSIKRYSP